MSKNNHISHWVLNGYLSHKNNIISTKCFKTTQHPVISISIKACTLSVKINHNKEDFCNQKGGKNGGYKYFIINNLVETAGIEESYCYFSNLLKTPNLQKTKNLPNMPLCAVVCHCVWLFPKMVTFLVTFCWRKSEMAFEEIM